MLVSSAIDTTATAPLNNPRPLIAADFNGDGKPDIPTRTGILLGKGDGTFSEPLPFAPEAIDVSADPVAALDLNGDGYIDLVVGGSGFWPAANRVWIYFGTGNGGMSPATTNVVGWGPEQSVAADLDGDGKPDLATANVRSNTISLLLTGGTPPRPLARAVSAASGSAMVAQGSLATLDISLPGVVTSEAREWPWPMSLGGFRLELRDSAGTFSLAPLLYLSATQINFQVPESAAAGDGSLALFTNDVSIPIGAVEVDPVAPGVFLAQDWSMLPAALLRRVHADGSRTEQPLFVCDENGGCGAAAVLPSSGDAVSYLVLYGTGFRGASSSEVTCLLRGESYPVEHAGPSGIPGVTEIVVRLPDEGADIWQGDPGGSIMLAVQGIVSNTVWFFVEIHERCGWLVCEKF